jgi:hypothetical protein
MLNINIGDKVKVVDQTIWGEVVGFDGHKIVILDANPDQDLEEGDEPRLTFRKDELETDFQLEANKT